ncbi:MAG: SUMF1/EgtB/PvdO family nonheme iron enzyme [Pseudomonadota bacterium]
MLNSFAICRYEISFTEYDQFAEATKRQKPDDLNRGRKNRPVINITWNDAIAYLNWLTTQTGKPYSLPSENQWKYAAQIRRAKSKNNPFGLFDMIGNVWEWIADPENNNAPKEKKQMIRGCPWLNTPKDCRTTKQLGLSSNTKSNDIGFRCISPTTK